MDKRRQKVLVFIENLGPSNLELVFGAGSPTLCIVKLEFLFYCVRR